MLRTLLLFLRLLRLLGDPVTCLDVPCCSHFSDVVLLAFPCGRFPWRCPLARTLFPWPCPVQGPPEAPGPPFALLLLSGGLWGFPETAASAPTRPPFPRADCFARCGPSPGRHRGWGSRCDHSRTPVVPALGSDALSARQSQDRAVRKSTRFTKCRLEGSVSSWGKEGKFYLYFKSLKNSIPGVP